MKRGLHHLVKEYGAVPGTPPRGFKREAINIGTRRDGRPHIVHKWVPDPDWIPAIHRAFELRASGATYRQISEETRLYKSVNSYLTFFSNPLYIGVLKFGELTIEDYCIPIVDRGTWEAVQAITAANNYSKRFPGDKNTNHPRRNGEKFVLSGLLYCAQCGAAMNGHLIKYGGKEPREYYICSKAKRTRGQACNARLIPRQFLEDLVVTELEKFFDAANLQDIQQELQSEQNNIEQTIHHEQRLINTDLVQVRRKIRNINNAIAEMGGSRRLYQTLKELEAEEAILTAKASQYQDPQPDPLLELTDDGLAALGTNLAGQLAASEPNELKEFIEQYIARITVERDDKIVRGLVRYYTHGIKKRRLI